MARGENPHCFSRVSEAPTRRVEFHFDSSGKKGHEREMKRLLFPADSFRLSVPGGATIDRYPQGTC